MVTEGFSCQDRCIQCHLHSSLLLSSSQCGIVAAATVCYCVYNHEIPSLGFPGQMPGSKATNINDQCERRGLGKRKKFFYWCMAGMDKSDEDNWECLEMIVNRFQ